MSEVTLIAEPGRAGGSRPSGRIRLEGRIPAVVYGHGTDPLSVSINRRELRAALHTDAGHNALIDLHVGSERHLTIVKDLQRHPVRNEVVHVDFLVVNRDEVVTVDTPIVLQGEAKQVAQANGTVDQQLFALTVHAKPGDIPNEIIIDISDLTIGDSVRVGDLPLPDGVTTSLDLEETVVVAQVSRATIEAEQLEEEAAAAAEGEEAAETEGEEAAGEAAKEEATEQAGGADETTP
jgi:large subunit ribosomal protein L25